MSKLIKTLPPRSSKVLIHSNKREAGLLADLAICQRSFLYDFSVDGGAVGTISYKNILPKNACISRIFVDIQTAATSGGSATYRLLAGSTNLTAATAYDSATEGINNVGVLQVANSASSPFDAIKLSANAELKLTIGTAALTAGKVRFTIEYFISK